jgi:hypothetical protein
MTRRGFRAKGLIIKSQLGHLRGRVIMDQQVCIADEANELLPLLAQVEGDATFVGVQVKKEAALFRIGNAARKRTALAREIAAGFFDFDHIRTKISHELGCI